MTEKNPTTEQHQQAVWSAYAEAFSGARGRTIFIDLAGVIHSMRPEQAAGAAVLYGYLLSKATRLEREQARGKR